MAAKEQNVTISIKVKLYPDQKTIEEFKKLMEGTLEVVLVDIDQEPALTDFYTVESTPTFILFRKGQQLWRQSGELPLERLERAVKGFKS